MEIPVKKNETYVVDIIDQGYEGEGISKIEGYTIFVPNAIKGEKCKILIVKVASSHAFGKLIEIIKPSKERVDVDCSTYKRCGGCNLRHMDYKATLNLKTQIVQNLVNKTLSNKIIVKSTIGMKKPYNYRNKAQYPIGYDKNSNIVTGVFASRTHEIVPIKNCKIQEPVSEIIAKLVIKFLSENSIAAYDENTGKGLFRHIVIKVGKKTKEIMCIFVINEEKFEKERELVKYLIDNFEKENTEYTIKTIIKNINNKNTNVILGNLNIILYGNGYIYDKLGEYTFKISPMSFYQTNHIQTEILYNKAIELAKLKNNDIVLDLYCGIGTIGIFTSKFVKQVYGIEVVKQAIEDAKENARLNKVENIEFLCGDVEESFEKLLKDKNLKPNVIFVDPPRRGLDKTTIENILRVEPEKLIYISCNPATMVRDLKLLEEKYNIKEIQPVDMFPYTSHVECVSVLKLKKTIEK